MLIIKEVTTHLNYRGAPITVDAVQGDSGRGVVLHCMSGETPWSLPEEANIVLQYRCEDGTGGVYDTLADGQPAYSVDGDAITVFFAPEVCAVAGCTKFQVTVISANLQLSTFHMEIRIAPQVEAGTAAGNYINLEQWLKKARNVGNGIYVGTAAPASPEVSVWINPEGEGIPAYNGEVL